MRTLWSLWESQVVGVGLVVVLALALLGLLREIWRAWQRTERDRRQARSSSRAQKDYENVRKALEDRHNSTVVDLIDDLGEVHKGRAGATLHIDYETAMAVLNRIRYAKGGPIDLVLHTLGGYSFAAEMIAAALQSHPGRVTAYVPFVAMSGGTIVALAASKIHMGKNAALGPIDSTMGGFSLEDFARLLKEKPISEIDDYTLLLAYEAEKYQRNAHNRACDIINNAHKPSGANDCRVVDALMSSKLPHGMRIDRKHAASVGVKVDDNCPKEIYDLVEARLQAIRASDRPTPRNGNGNGNGAAEHASQWVR